MPQVKFDHLVSFSSEDPKFPAKNLLSNNIVNKRWLGENKGESSNSVVLQLAKSTQITSLHIGTYHSALVEVLVGRSETPSQVFEVLLCASSFMSPSDSRNSENVDRVRTFTSEQLAGAVAAASWDRIRVVCTQPFNRHVQYGLSFINVFSSDTQPASPVLNTVKLNVPSTLGRFKVKYDSSDEDEDGGFKPGELFKQLKTPPPLSTDAQIRNAVTLRDLNPPKDSHLLVKTLLSKVVNKNAVKKVEAFEDSDIPSRKRDSLMYNDEDDVDNTKIDKIIKRDRDEKARLNVIKIAKEEDAKKKVEANKKQSTGTKKTLQPNKEEKKAERPEDKGHTNEKNTPENKKRASSHSDDQSTSKKHRVDDISGNIPRGPQCMRGVVFVLSGYVNPKRAVLRDGVLRLGARYSTDWNTNCTHLICAFPNTPKHAQVRQSSRDTPVVSGQWLEECSAEGALLPWQWFSLDSRHKLDRPLSLHPGPSAVTVSESDGDTDDEIEEVQKKTKNDIKTKNQKPDILLKPNSPLIARQNSSSSDMAASPSVTKFTIDTDSDEMKSNEISSLNDEALPDFFSGIKFYVDYHLNEEDFNVQEIKRYIWAYDGQVYEDWPNKAIDVAVTTPELAQALSEKKFKKCKLMRPEWVWKCNDTKSLYPYQDYSIH